MPLIRNLLCLVITCYKLIAYLEEDDEETLLYLMRQAEDCKTFTFTNTNMAAFTTSTSVTCTTPPTEDGFSLPFNMSVSPALIGGIVAGGVLAVGVAVVAAAAAPGAAATGGLSAAPQPGSAGGGGLPVGSSALAVEALALVPFGLQAVAVFPPYATPRRFQAVSVIFRENVQKRAIIEYHNTLRRQRRSILHTLRYKAENIKQFLSRKLSQIGEKLRRLKSAIFKSQTDNSQNVELFGFRSRVRLVRNDPCILGVSCDLQGNKLQKRQTGERFVSAEAPPECRTEFDRNACDFFN